MTESITNQMITVKEDCPAVLVPAGTPVLLPKGTEVRITQALGSSVTVSIYGNLARIAEADLPKLGEGIAEKVQAEIAIPENASVEEQCWSQLKSCYDPEIPVNIVDLGLIYEVKITDVENKLHHIAIKMTLTAPGCGIGPTLMAEIEQKIRALPSVANVTIDLVFDPPWHREMMSDDAKLKLNLF